MKGKTKTFMIALNNVGLKIMFSSCANGQWKFRIVNVNIASAKLRNIKIMRDK